MNSISAKATMFDVTLPRFVGIVVCTLVVLANHQMVAPPVRISREVSEQESNQNANSISTSQSSIRQLSADCVLGTSIRDLCERCGVYFKDIKAFDYCCHDIKNVRSYCRNILISYRLGEND